MARLIKRTNTAGQDAWAVARSPIGPRAEGATDTGPHADPLPEEVGTVVARQSPQPVAHLDDSSPASVPSSLGTEPSSLALSAQSPAPGRARPFLRHVAVIFWKDVLTEFRRRELVLSALVFSLLVLVIFDFAFDLKAGEAAAAAPGILWVTFIFAGVLALNRVFAGERDGGTLDGLILAPVDPGAIYLAKLLTSLAFMLTVEAISLVAFGAFFGVKMDVGWLALVVVLGTLGFSTVGTLFAALSANTRAREVLLPVLLFPVAVPVLIAAVQASGQALGTAQPAANHPWVGLLIAYDAIFLAVSFAIFEYVLEE